jgi:hypothetical protein
MSLPTAGLNTQQVAYHMNSHSLARSDRQILRGIHDPAWLNGLKIPDPRLLVGNLGIARSAAPTPRQTPPVPSSARSLSVDQGPVSSRSVLSEGWLCPARSSRELLRSTYGASFTTPRRTDRLPDRGRELWNLGKQGKQFTSHDNSMFLF